MQCKNKYYEAYKGFMCDLNKKKCSEENCELKKIAVNFSEKVAKILKAGDYVEQNVPNERTSNKSSRKQ